ncbi:MAG: M42 family metallopeptidase [Clostridia bacterium]|nr:M42 family metallopeptidase [Clostridia bacterium]MBQ9966389.1 M42 family metallopeptidase [Clostridia bacterium]
MNKLIETLTSIPSACGHEYDVIRYLRDRLKDKASECHVDGLGNLIVRMDGGLPGPTLMISAHSDEVGFIVKKIENNGLIRFEKIGGNDDRILPIEKVVVCTQKGPVKGLIGFISAHMRKFDKADMIRPYNQLYIDVGAKDKADAEAMGIEIGDAIVWGTQYEEFGNGRAMGHAFDDKVGCAIQAKIIEELDFSKVRGTVYFIFSVQEEVGLRGARTASHAIHADVALSIDTTAASDTFESMMDQMVCLGKGPGIKAMDFSFISSVAVRRKLQKVAKENNIPYQLEVFTGIGTDAGELHMAHEGVPTGSVSVPSRNAHTALEVIDLQDVEYAKQLLEAFILALEDKDEFAFVR